MLTLRRLMDKSDKVVLFKCTMAPGGGAASSPAPGAARCGGRSSDYLLCLVANRGDLMPKQQLSDETTVIHTNLSHLSF